MTRDEAEAIESFERLGLTSYEAKVFIALQRLGSGTARDIADVADVPRSQVYSVAEGLERQGLIEVQQSSPIRYRPVSVAEARETLHERFEREHGRAFEYVETVRSKSDGEEEQEDIWTVRGRERIDDRVVDLLSNARERIVFGTRLPVFLTEDIERALERHAAAGIDVLAVSSSDDVAERMRSLDGVSYASPPEHQGADDRSGRIVIVDDDTILLSVVDEDENETAIWSAESLFASVFIQLAEARVDPTGESS